MTKVFADNYYMKVWEEIAGRNEDLPIFEPDFSSDDLIRLKDSFYIKSKDHLQQLVEEKLFPYYSQFTREEFDVKETEHGWIYVGFFIMDDNGCKIGLDSDSYTHSLMYEVEVYNYPEVNGMRNFK